MEIITTFRQLKIAQPSLTRPLGFVPTMGYLHAGHLSLVEAARRDCASVAVSIFVNPKQFGPHEDFARYPRDLPRDLSLLESAGVDLVWVPAAEEMYPAGFQTWVDVKQLSRPLEGQFRRGHFRGVTTVVTKLFHAIQPDRAYFGQKDAQQAAVIRRMIKDLDFGVEIIVCPTLREVDGLAMSSRNIYLKSDERKAATVLFRALTAARSANLKGERKADELREIVRRTIAKEKLVSLQYVSCADYDTLEELTLITGKTLLSLAAQVGRTRLIDNIVLE